MTKNQIEYWKNVETERHNQELEKQGLESLKQAAEANRIAAMNAATQATSVNEAIRSNKAREQETNRSNLAREANDVLRTNETIRSNQANEAIATYNAQTNRINAGANLTMAAAAASQAETAKTNAVTHQKSQKETVRANMANESIKSNSNPWVSIATTLKDVVPRVAEKVVNSNLGITVNGLINSAKYNLTQSRTIAPISGQKSKTKLTVSNYNR